MAEYIEREAAIKAIDHEVSLDGLYANIKAIPAADVRPEILGWWITKYGGKPFCSYCGYNEGGAMQTSWKYCPNCGAKMDGKDGNCEDNSDNL